MCTQLYSFITGLITPAFTFIISILQEKEHKYVQHVPHAQRAMKISTAHALFSNKIRFIEQEMELARVTLRRKVDTWLQQLNYNSQCCSLRN